MFACLKYCFNVEKRFVPHTFRGNRRRIKSYATKCIAKVQTLRSKYIQEGLHRPEFIKLFQMCSWHLTLSSWCYFVFPFILTPYACHHAIPCWSKPNQRDSWTSTSNIVCWERSTLRRLKDLINWTTTWHSCDRLRSQQGLRMPRSRDQSRSFRSPYTYRQRLL